MNYIKNAFYRLNYSDFTPYGSIGDFFTDHPESAAAALFLGGTEFFNMAGSDDPVTRYRGITGALAAFFSVYREDAQRRRFSDDENYLSCLHGIVLEFFDSDRYFRYPANTGSNFSPGDQLAFDAANARLLRLLFKSSFLVLTAAEISRRTVTYPYIAGTVYGLKTSSLFKQLHKMIAFPATPFQRSCQLPWWEALEAYFLNLNAKERDLFAATLASGDLAETKGRGDKLTYLGTRLFDLYRRQILLVAAMRKTEDGEITLKNYEWEGVRRSGFFLNILPDHGIGRVSEKARDYIYTLQSLHRELRKNDVPLAAC